MKFIGIFVFFVICLIPLARRMSLSHPPYKPQISSLNQGGLKKSKKPYVRYENLEIHLRKDRQVMLADGQKYLIPDNKIEFIDKIKENIDKFRNLYFLTLSEKFYPVPTLIFIDKESEPKMISEIVHNYLEPLGLKRIQIAFWTR